MDYHLDEEFRSICQEIAAEEKTADEWADVEAADMFQAGKYSGGFDADEAEFCFSVYLADGEYWFQVSLAEVRQVAEGKNLVVEVQPAG